MNKLNNYTYDNLNRLKEVGIDKYGRNWGVFASAGGYYGGASLYNGVDGYGNSYPHGDLNNYIYGAYAGLGVGGYLSNATCAEDLNGISETYSANFPDISLQYSRGGDIWMWSFSVMPSSILARVPLPVLIILQGHGLSAEAKGSFSKYQTNTIGQTLK